MEEPTGVSEKLSIQVQGQKWLAEMELVQDPNFINNLKLNILGMFPKIKEVEILSLHIFDNKRMLVWLEVSKWCWGKKNLLEDVEDLIKQIIPNFKVRVVLNYDIMRLALQKVDALYKEDTQENGSSQKS